MEQEMKYALPSKEVADNILNDAIITDIADSQSKEDVVMKAVYFDTADYDLSNNNMAVRVRAEGDHSFATLKWGGSASNGFHERNEINVPVSGDINLISLSAKTFQDSEDGKVLLDLIGDKPLLNLLEMRFVRHRMRLNYEGSLMELSLDQGAIITDAGEMPIFEMEIELFVGSVNHIKELGQKLADKYNLSVENRSKFARGLAMVRK